MSQINNDLFNQKIAKEDLLYRYSIYLGFTEIVARRKSKDFIEKEIVL